MMWALFTAQKHMAERQDKSNIKWQLVGNPCCDKPARYTTQRRPQSEDPQALVMFAV